jgi:hypothetical protein
VMIFYFSVNWKTVLQPSPLLGSLHENICVLDTRDTLFRVCVLDTRDTLVS